MIRAIALSIVCAFVVTAVPAMQPAPAAAAVDTRVPAGQVLQISVPEAIGGKTVVGQVAVYNAAARGFLTAYGCADGLPLDSSGAVSKSDLNYDGGVSDVWSNRLIVQADSAGEICLFTQSSVDMVVDVNGVSFDTGITSFPNRRTDTRIGVNTAKQRVAPGGVLRIRVPEAAGGKTVIGQLTVDRVADPGFVTAFACDAGVPRAGNGAVTRSDLNYHPRVGPSRSNRLIVQADASGDVCFYSSRLVELIVDVNGVADRGITSFANRRTDYAMVTDDPADLANSASYGEYLERMGALFGELRRVLRPRRYAVVIVRDAYQQGRYRFVASDLAARAEPHGFVTKGDLIWYQAGTRLRPYGYPHAFVPNIVHQHILVLRAE